MSSHRPWRRLSLASRLVIAFVGLLTLGLAVGTVAMTVILGMRLVDQIDVQLQSTAQLLGDQQLDQLQAESSASVFPVDYYVLIRDQYQDVELVQPETTQAYGAPDLGAYNFAVSQLDDPVPATVPSTAGGSPWRVITVPIYSSHTGLMVGSMTVGLPMLTTDDTVSDFLKRVVLIDLALVLVGAVLAFLLVARALAPLRQIENVAGRIAGGDLAQRVDPEPRSTEVGSLGHSLNAMLAQIEASFGARRASELRMRRFVSDASHELRTPLATVRGYGELYRLGGIPDSELPGAMSRIETEATRMSRLVDDLVQLARLDEGRALDLAQVDLLEVASDAAANLRALSPVRPATVVALDGGPLLPVRVVADEDRVRQLLANLTGNVVQHTPETAAVEIALGADGDDAVIEVRDHGPGVPVADEGRIFGRFFRTDVSRSRESGGTGLGLAIVQSVVSAHAGSVRAFATDGGGLTVRVTLPGRVADPDGVGDESDPA